MEGLDDDPSVTLRAPLMVLLEASRADVTAVSGAGRGLGVDGDAADVTVEDRLFGLRSLVG